MILGVMTLTRKPLPPGDLVDALNDRIHETENVKIRVDRVREIARTKVNDSGGDDLD
jgi:hypothetical protein